MILVADSQNPALMFSGLMFSPQIFLYEGQFDRLVEYELLFPNSSIFITIAY